MILSIRLHTLDATLSFMTLRVLNLVQLRSWSLLGSLLKKGQLELSYRINCMQFGILHKFCMWLTDLPVIGIVYPWTILVPF